VPGRRMFYTMYVDVPTGCSETTPVGKEESEKNAGNMIHVKLFA